MRIAIVGAGIAGLAAARALSDAGRQVVLFEKNDHPGGRVSTHRLGAYVLDSGASSIVPRSGAIQKVMLEELDRSELIDIERPIYALTGMRAGRGEAPMRTGQRYTYRSGNQRLAQLLAQGLDLRLGVQIESIERQGSGYRLAGEEFDAAILTPPVPQVAALLWTLGESRAFAHARYRPCLSVLLGFERPLPELPYHALLDPEQRQPLMWLGLESAKSPDRAPEGHAALVAQFSPTYSLGQFGATDERILADALDYVGQVLGRDWHSPSVWAVKRWKYALPESVAMFDTVNPPGSRLVVAGDGVLAGRVESAYESGLRAAGLLLAGDTQAAAAS